MRSSPLIRFKNDTDLWMNSEIFKLMYWNKTFSNVSPAMQNQINEYKTNITAKKLESLNLGKGNIKLLSTGNFEGFTTTQKCKNIYDEGEVITLPSGGTANIKYYNGKFISSGNYLAKSYSNVSPKFLYYHLKNIQNQIEGFFRGSSIKHPEMQDVFSINVLHPKYDIQTKIETFHTNLDSLIEQKFKELEKIKKHKQSMLNKMFPKKGSTVPEIRFDEFESVWKSDKFGSLFDKLSNNTFSRNQLNYKDGLVKNIHYGDVLIRYGFAIDIESTIVPFINSDVELINFKQESYLKTGDIVFADTAEDTTAGKMVEIYNELEIPTLSGLHTYPCRPLVDFEKGYLGIFMNTNHFHDQLIPYMQGSKVTSFNFEFLTRTLVSYPDKTEQKKIVDFFSNLDKLIFSQEREVQTLKHLKATLLSKMFA